jgi:hypothetical protein
MLVIVAGGQALAGEKAVKIGVLGDQSGPYADLGGPVLSWLLRWRLKITPGRCSVGQSRLSPPIC